MSPARRISAPGRAAAATYTRILAIVGHALREERRSRALYLRHVAEAAGVAISVVHDAENGHPVSLEALVRIASALDVRIDVTATPTRRRSRAATSDLVHSAMGELQSGHLRGYTFPTRIDEPYQHFQFAGRADVAAWDLERRALLHIENRTQFPDVQDAAGSYNAKRAYFGPVLAQRLGIPGWRSETHVIAALWSAEVLRVVRHRTATFQSLCPDSIDAFDAWWRGELPLDGTTSSLVIFDPAPDVGRARRYADLPAALRADPRYRDYADAARRLRLDGI